MKIVLLPGMDGTGKLFAPLLAVLSGFDCDVIKLPGTGPQDYQSITERVMSKLPSRDFILIAESFSGPIGLALASKQLPHLKGIIFVATFLSPPNRLLLTLAPFLPLKSLSSLPFSNYFHKALFLGADANDELLECFQSIVKSLPGALIKQRLRTMAGLKYQPQTINLPVLYIQALADHLVGKDKVREFQNTFQDLSVREIDGPHFILQANSSESSLAITEFYKQLNP